MKDRTTNVEMLHHLFNHMGRDQVRLPQFVFDHDAEVTKLHAFLLLKVICECIEFPTAQVSATLDFFHVSFFPCPFPHLHAFFFFSNR